MAFVIGLLLSRETAWIAGQVGVPADESCRSHGGERHDQPLNHASGLRVPWKAWGKSGLRTSSKFEQSSRGLILIPGSWDSTVYKLYSATFSASLVNGAGTLAICDRTLQAFIRWFIDCPNWII
ncbi:hypothetical protein C8Q69DRAFT_448045 [Paecilomyces variotii]|uniref:Uncharacterized protein n=1 Tax=Byssochlamys spectabilis TaxID=264951 RepID=A0A443HJF1_BYSSP|nr:hypothetical protein C8Q69DRAFT_448045 [Paecilomyces variotii]RWQ91962.1 hypothetical protein C8Q69DRAFT_448045 [Paecilomyces variotii]